MSDRTRAFVALAVLLGAAPLAAQGPSAAALRAEARRLQAEVDSMARADRERVPVLDRVRVPGGWTAAVSPAIAATAPDELGEALTALRQQFGAPLFPDTMTITVTVDTGAYHSVLVQVGKGSSFGRADGPLRPLPEPGLVHNLAFGAGLTSLTRSEDSSFRVWVGGQPFAYETADYTLRARMELGTLPAPSVTGCRHGDLAACRGALGLVAGDSGALTTGARTSLFLYAFDHRPDGAALARFYADSAQPLADRLGALAARSPDQLVRDWRGAVLVEGNTRSADVTSALIGALVLGALALAGFRRRAV